MSDPLLSVRRRCLYVPFTTRTGDRLGAEHNKHPRYFALDWPSFARELATNHVQATKQDAPAWSPGEIREGGTRKAAATLHVHDLVLDLDYGTAADQVAVLRRALSMGLTCVMYSTFRHTDLKPRTRLVIPLTTPVPAELWSRFYVLASHEMTQGAKTLDTQTPDPCRLWYSPSRPSLDAPYVYYYQPIGTALDPSDWLVKSKRPDAFKGLLKQDPFRQTTKRDLQRIQRKWERSQHQHAGTLANLIATEPYAIEGKRDTVTFQLTRDLIREAPELTTDSLVSCFMPSLQLMGAPSTYQEKVADMIERARDAVIEEGPKDASLDLSEVVPLTDKERGVPLLVHVDDSSALYLYSHGSYTGPVGRDDRMASIKTHLAPAIKAGHMQLQTDSGADIPVEDLILRYGRTVTDVAYEIGLSAPRFDADSGLTTLVLPTAYRTGTPLYSPNVEAFLRFLSPSEAVYLDLCTWLVVAKTLPLDGLPALAFVGPKGLGKGLFASCAAQLWHNGPPIPATEALSAHAQGLLKCPLVFADEQMPVDARTGRMASAAFREAIGAKAFRVNPKFKAPVTVHGAQRWIVAVNDLDKLEFREDLGPDSIAAVTERIYPIDLRATTRGPLPPIPPDVAVTVLAEFFGHVLWLAQHHQLPARQHRFWIAPADDMLHRYMLAEGPPTRGLVLYWLTYFLRQPAALKSSVPRIQVDSTTTPEDLAVSVRDILDTWGLIHPGIPRPSPPVIARHLAILADPKRPEALPSGAIPLDYSLVLDWAKRHKVAEDKDFRPSLAPVGRGQSENNVVPLFGGLARAKAP